MKKPFGSIIILVLTLGIGAGICWQANTIAQLRGDRARLQRQAEELAHLRANQASLKASLVSAAELDALQRAAIEAGQLRNAIESLKTLQVQADNTEDSSPTVQKKRESAWHNAGQAAPADTLHSVIWAAVNGDVDALMPMLVLDPESRVLAENLLASLPESVRGEYPTVDKLIATMISGRMSTHLEQADVLAQTDVTPDLISAKCRLAEAPGSYAKPREVTLCFQRSGANWQLLVPKSVVEGYGASLRAR